MGKNHIWILHSWLFPFTRFIMLHWRETNYTYEILRAFNIAQWSSEADRSGEHSLWKNRCAVTVINTDVHAAVVRSSYPAGSPLDLNQRIFVRQANRTTADPAFAIHCQPDGELFKHSWRNTVKNCSDGRACFTWSFHPVSWKWANQSRLLFILFRNWPSRTNYYHHPK